MNVPYISITDFTNLREVVKMLSVFKEAGGQEIGRRLGVGIMMSYKTLRELPTPFSAIFPKKEGIAGIFTDDPLVFNVIHYADYKDRDVLNSLKEAVKWGGKNLHAIQLDMTWPDPMAIMELCRIFSHVKIILQIGRMAFRQIGENPSSLLTRLEEYGDAINYVLLDKSMGEGKELSPEFLIPFMDFLVEHRPDLGLAVAGGLGPNSAHLISPLASRYCDLSTDAQGGLRPSRSYFDPIDWKMAGDYQVEMIKILKNVR